MAAEFMKEQERNNPPVINELLSIPAIAEIAAILEEQLAHLAAMVELDCADEENRHAVFYAENGVKDTRTDLLDVICELAFSSTISFDETVALLRHFGFDHTDALEADYDEIVGQFAQGAEILLKKHFHYPEHVRGVISSQAMLTPFIDTQGLFHAVISVDVTADDVIDAEIVPIRTSSRTGERGTPTVVVGSEAIEEYLAAER